MDYLKPYVDEFITDTYGSAVAVINPEAPYKVVISAIAIFEIRAAVGSTPGAGGRAIPASIKINPKSFEGPFTL